MCISNPTILPFDELRLSGPNSLLDTSSLHNFVEFAILLSTDEVSMFVSKFDLEPDFMVESFYYL